MLNNSLLDWIETHNQKTFAAKLADIQKNYVRALEGNLFQYKDLVSEEVLRALSVDLTKATLQLKALEEAAR